jgi:CDP-diacylglycerol--serine O-phosphatidyltransferase
MLKQFKGHIPNTITLLNLACGSVSVIMALSDQLILASWFIYLAAVLDFLDGFLARLLNARSHLGAQLDSLADVISFGLAPAVILFVLVSDVINYTEQGGRALLPLLSLLIVVASAYRLARFNTEPAQQERFSGLPTPAMGLFIASLPLAFQQYSENALFINNLGNPYILLLTGFVLSWLMVSRVPLMSMKMKNLTWRDNRYRYILAGISICMVSFFGFAGIPVSIAFYIILSLFDRK